VTELELLVDCLSRLNRADVAYMLTGSMASNYWGIPRSTHDLDFVVRVPDSAVAALVAAFAGDFFIQESSVRAAFNTPFQFNAIDNRSGLKIDFWMLRDEPFEQEMFGRRLRVELLAQPAFVASAEDVILHKLYWNTISPSHRQLQDAAGVVAVQGDSLDRRYLRFWASQLKVAETLEQLLEGKIRPKET
jgi:hypothetical protein